MLRYNRQRQIVAVATVVVDLVSVAVGGKHRAVEKITECARNRRRRSIVDHCENCAWYKRATSKIGKGKLRAGVDGHAVGDHFVGGGGVAVHFNFADRVGVKCQRALDGKRSGASSLLQVTG